MKNIHHRLIFTFSVLIMISCATSKLSQKVDQNREIPKALNSVMLYFKNVKWVCGKCDTVLIDPIIQIDTTCDFTYGNANMAYYYSEIDTISFPAISKNKHKIYFSSIRELKKNKYFIDIKKLVKGFRFFSKNDNILKGINGNLFKVFHFSPLISTDKKNIYNLWVTVDYNFDQVGYIIKLERTSQGYVVTHLSYEDIIKFSAKPDYIGN